MLIYRLRTLALALLLVAFAHRLTAQERKPAGPLAIAELDFPTLVDAKRRGHKIPIKVHYPKTAGPHPLVVYSHGGGGNRDAHVYEAQHLASHGYVVLCLEHVRSNNLIVRYYTKTGKGSFKARFKAALMKITRDPKAVLDRPKDVTFAIDRAIAWNRDHPALKGRIDARKIAVAGHSYGAGTVLTACGARASLDHLDGAGGKGLAPNLGDPRITCGIAMSPQGPGTSRFTRASYATINRPMLCLSGSEDHQLGHDGSTQPATRRLDGFKLFPTGDAGVKYMAWLENADHMAFADNPKSWILPSRSRADTQRILKPLTLAFCDLFLKGKISAKKKLGQRYVDTLVGKVVTRVTWYTRE